jgi:hypothetical protein
MHKKPGVFSPTLGETSTMRNVRRDVGGKKWTMGSRPCAVFEYQHKGEPMDVELARALISGANAVAA